MGEFLFDTGLVTLIVIVIIAVLIAMIAFRHKHRSREEREENQHKLWITIAVIVVVAVAVYWLYGSYHGDKNERHHRENKHERTYDRDEYGYIETFQKRFQEARDRRAAGKEAYQQAFENVADKRAAQQAQREASRQLKHEQRAVKYAGQQAAAAAEQQARANLAAGQIPYAAGQFKQNVQPVKQPLVQQPVAHKADIKVPTKTAPTPPNVGGVQNKGLGAQLGH